MKQHDGEHGECPQAVDLGAMRLSRSGHLHGFRLQERQH
jgi:hypothetical protein